MDTDSLNKLLTDAKVSVLRKVARLYRTQSPGVLLARNDFGEALDTFASEIEDARDHTLNPRLDKTL